MNNTNTTLTIKTPKKLRNEAKKTAKELGLPLGTVVNAMLRQFVLEKEITLSVKKPQDDLKQAMKDLRAGKGEQFSGTTEEFFDYLSTS